MNICYIIPALSKFGPNLVVYDLVNLMMGRGHYVKVYYFDDDKKYLLSFPCETERIRFGQRIDFSQYDVVHSHCLRPDAYVFFHKPKNCSSYFVTTLHNFVKQDLTTTYNSVIANLFTPIWMKMVSRHDKIVTLSQVAKDYYKQWFKEEQLTYVYNTRKVNANKDLSNEEKKELLQFKGKSFLIGVNAGYDNRKGADQLLRALPNLLDVKIFMVWRGDRPDLKKLAKDLKVESQVFFAGYREDAYRYLNYYDAFAVPSRSEGFPLAMLEAVSMKCNMICSDIPIFKEFFTEEEMTFFHLEDIPSLQRAIKEAMLTNKSEAAYLKYLRNFSPDVIAQRYIDVYERR